MFAAGFTTAVDLIVRLRVNTPKVVLYMLVVSFFVLNIMLFKNNTKYLIAHLFARLLLEIRDSEGNEMDLSANQKAPYTAVDTHRSCPGFPLARLLVKK